MSATFLAHDAMQRRHLLMTLKATLEMVPPWRVAELAERTYEGTETSLYLFSFYLNGFSEGHEKGHRDGFEDALVGRGSKHVAQRAQHRRKKHRR